MNNDLISREALKKAIDNAYKEYDGYEPHDLMRFAERVDTEIDNAPTVEYTFEEAFQKTVCEQGLYCPKRPQGKWIKNAEEWQRIDPPYFCSECGHANLRKTPFCEMCGADMRKETSNGN